MVILSPRILKHFRVSINEPSYKPSKSISDEVVYALEFEWHNGTWVKFTENKYTMTAQSDDHTLNDVVLIDQLPDFRFLFKVNVGVRTLQCLQMILMPLHLLYHLRSL